MRLLPQKSIRAKLMMLATASGCVALTLACLGFMSNDVRLMHDGKMQQMASQAELLGLSSSEALAVKDQAAAGQLLEAIKIHSSIDSAILFDGRGERLAELLPGNDQPDPPVSPELLGFRYDPQGRLEYVHPVMEAGQRVGTIYLRSNMSDLDAQVHSHRYIAVWVALCSLAASIVLSFFLQQIISRPILKLAETADQITRQGDYSLRVKSPSQDEIGHLFAAFNKMLDRVQVSDRALKRAHDELEERVAQRTTELVREIRERERIGQDLIQAKDAAEAANRAKSEFLANMSHEIRTPLNAILGFADLVRQGNDLTLAEQHDYLATIHQSGQHLLSLISDILDLSKIEAGQLSVEMIRCSPQQIVAETVSVLRVRAREKGLKLDYHWVGDIPETIESDPARMRQMLLNVVGNAIKFTDSGGVHIIAQVVGPLDNPRLLIEVVDTGIGIQLDKLQTIFDPFCQADTSVTRRFGGTGLGLAICRRLANALGGGVTVQSRPGEGSIFSISISTGSLVGVPMTEGMQADVARPRAEAHARRRISLAGKRILVADDGDTNRKLIQIVLRRAGAEVLCAENGHEALELGMRERLDAILMDMQMPVMDGYTATARLREAGSNAPILALTAHAMKGDNERCREAGCTGYLTKPISAERLLAAIAAETGIETATDETPDEAERGNGAALLSTLPLDDVEFRDIVEEFVARFQTRLASMHKAMDARDVIELKSLAHWLKGAGGTAGFQPLTETAFELEMALTAEDFVAAAAALQELDGLEQQILSGMCCV
jgi:signal transduction histidine kinase/DNA-binding response OmpR family regulator